MWVTQAGWPWTRFVASVLTSEDAEDFGDQGVRGTGLGHKPIAAGACGALQLAGFVVSGQCDDWNMSRARIILQSAGRFPSIENGQAQIHQYDVWTMSSRVRECVGAVAGLYHVEA